MPSRLLVAGAIAAAAASLVLPAPPVRADDDDPEVARIAAEADEIAKVVEEIRGLKFTGPVAKGIQDRDELRKFILEELAKELPDEKIQALAKAYAKLGFFEPGLDLKGILVDLYTEQIAAFYSPEMDKLFLVQRGGPEQAMVISHELVHALQDQHFDLDRLKAATVGNDDRSLALTSVVEGDATVVMVAYLLQAQTGMKGIDVKSLPDIGMILKFSTQMGELMGQGGEAMKRAPKVLTENLMFGYMDGASFCQKVVKSKGHLDSLTHLFRDLPLSSEQILHPEKYMKEPRDVPMAVTFPAEDLAKELGGPWKLLERNVMGEFNTALLLTEKLDGGKADRAAAGWDGDAWQAIENTETGEVVLVWTSTWDTAEDRDEFKAAYEAFAQARDGGKSNAVTLALELAPRLVIVDGGSKEMKEKLLVLAGNASVQEGYPPEGPVVAEKTPEDPTKQPPSETPPMDEAAGPPFRLSPPEGFAAIDPGSNPHLVEGFEGPDGARVELLEFPTAAKDVEAAAKRAEERLRNAYEDFEKLSGKRRDGGGLAVYELSFRATPEGATAPLRFVQWIAVEGGKQYVASRRAPERFWKEHKAAFRASVHLREGAGEGTPKKGEPTLY